MKINNLYLLLLFIITIVLIGLQVFYNKLRSNKMIETYQSLGDDQGKYPFYQEHVILEDNYPVTGRKGITNNSAIDIWWHYPIFQLGSYDQITNNIKYPNNPDEGTCMPASMCGALYKKKQLKSNYIKPLPQINSDSGTRVGYFDTNINLLPFRTDMQNILY